MRRLYRATSPLTLLYVTVVLCGLTPYTEENYHDNFCVIISSLQEKGSLQSDVSLLLIFHFHLVLCLSQPAIFGLPLLLLWLSTSYQFYI